MKQTMQRTSRCHVVGKDLLTLAVETVRTMSTASAGSSSGIALRTKSLQVVLQPGGCPQAGLKCTALSKSASTTCTRRHL